MARPRSHSRGNTRSRNGKRDSGTSPGLIVGVAALALAIVGLVLWLVLRDGGTNFSRSQLDRYVEATSSMPMLEDGASVYIDMSNGMNHAYATDDAKAVLRGVINKLAANDAVAFFGLSSGEIYPMTMSHTDLYNRLLSPASYTEEQAPIEKTLATIVERRQPALILTDFEEYNKGVIQRAAYAKPYFIQWLAMGGNITFYKWGFTENGKEKWMFLAVMDDNASRLNALVADAVYTVDPQMDTFVMGGHGFMFPMRTNYASFTRGGNYHNSQGYDAVTAVLEDGSSEAYRSYTQTVASATGGGAFAPLDWSMGEYAEYYPLGVDWANAVANAASLSMEGVPAEDAYEHLLARLYVDFTAQDGYDIEGIEARVFNFQPVMDVVASYAGSADSLSIATAAVKPVEINDMLTATLVEQVGALPQGWQEIVVDFDSRFTGSLGSKAAPDDLLRVNIVIARASVNVADVSAFFGWPGNPSLETSVAEALKASSSTPQGRILYTYYLKTII